MSMLFWSNHLLYLIDSDWHIHTLFITNYGLIVPLLHHFVSYVSPITLHIFIINTILLFQNSRLTKNFPQSRISRSPSPSKKNSLLTLLTVEKPWWKIAFYSDLGCSFAFEIRNSNLVGISCTQQTIYISVTLYFRVELWNQNNWNNCPQSANIHDFQPEMNRNSPKHSSKTTARLDVSVASFGDRNASTIHFCSLGIIPFK